MTSTYDAITGITCNIFTCMTSSYSLVPPFPMPSKVLKGAVLHMATTTCALGPCLSPSLGIGLGFGRGR